MHKHIALSIILNAALFSFSLYPMEQMEQQEKTEKTDMENAFNQLFREQKTEKEADLKRVPSLTLLTKYVLRELPEKTFGILSRLDSPDLYQNSKCNKILIVAPPKIKKFIAAFIIALTTQKTPIMISLGDFISMLNTQCKDESVEKGIFNSNLDNKAFIIRKLEMLEGVDTERKAALQNNHPSLYLRMLTRTNNPKALFIATTTDTELLPLTLKKFFGVNTLKLKPFSSEIDELLLYTALAEKKLQLDESCSPSYLSQLLRKLDRTTNSNIEKLVEGAITWYACDNLDATEIVLSKKHFDKALEELKEE